MNFFNKFKDLFEVPPNLPIPNSKLRIDNELFIEKPYVNTYSQEYSLNTKLRQFKKDYNEFQNQINQIQKINQTPKRSFSRTGKQKIEKNVTPMAQKPKNQMAPQFKQNQQNNRSFQRENRLITDKKKYLADSMKRQNWLKDEQNNILKHSEIDHIFNSKLSSNTYNLDRLQEPILPKIEMSQSYTYSKPKNQAFLIKNRSRPSINDSKTQKNSSNTSKGTAQSRREQAKANLDSRRRKLQQILRTGW